MKFYLASDFLFSFSLLKQILRFTGKMVCG